jgi:hypothetical protein
MAEAREAGLIARREGLLKTSRTHASDYNLGVPVYTNRSTRLPRVRLLSPSLANAC